MKREEYKLAFIRRIENSTNPEKVALCLLMCSRMHICASEYERVFTSGSLTVIDRTINELWKYAISQNVDLNSLMHDIRSIIPDSDDVPHPIVPYFQDICFMLLYIICYLQDGNIVNLHYVCDFVYDSIFRYVEDKLTPDEVCLSIPVNEVEGNSEYLDLMNVEHERQERDYRTIVGNVRLEEHFIQSIMDNQKRESCIGFFFVC